MHLFQQGHLPRYGDYPQVVCLQSVSTFSPTQVEEYEEGCEGLLTHLSLFSGIGGLDLAAEAAGCVTVGQCEWADYPTKVLEKHWPDVPRWRDVRTLTGESFFEKTSLRTVDIVSGGFPCQPFSTAGKRGGQNDDRYLWPEMLRVIRELKPTWVVGENVPGIVNLALDTVLSDLEAEGYASQAFIIPACGVDAPHRRDRVCILAHSESKFPYGRLHRCEKDLAEDGPEGADHRRGAESIWERERWQDKLGNLIKNHADAVNSSLVAGVIKMSIEYGMKDMQRHHELR